MKLCPQCNRMFDTLTELQECPDCSVPILAVEEEESLIDKTIKDEFTIKALIGQGGMGTVYRAYQHSMERDIAIKILKRSYATDVKAVKRFYKEARTASRLKSPHTIVVHDFGQMDNGLLYITMELLVGQSLQRIIEAEGRLKPLRAVNILTQICQSLYEAHAIGMIHRDLKPDNVFVSPQADGTEFVKVLDFGIAKVVGTQSTSLTAEGAICGTPVYMSPEQALGRELTHKSDIYSLGVILFQMITGKPPFAATTPMGLLYKHVHEPPPQLSAVLSLTDVPRDLQELLNTMLVKKPEHRPESVLDVQKQITTVDLDLHLMPTAVVSPVSSDTLASPLAYENTAVSATPPDTGDIGLLATQTPAELYRESRVAGTKKKKVYLVAVPLVVGALALLFYLVMTTPWFLRDKSAGHPAVQTQPDTSVVAIRKPASDTMATTSVTSVDTRDAVGGSTTTAVDNAVAAAGSQVAVPPQTAPRPKTVSVQIQSEPAGAQVVRDGRVVGKTPLTIEEQQSEEPVKLIVRREGYQDKPMTVSLEKDDKFVAKLTLEVQYVSVSVRTHPRGAEVFVDGRAVGRTPLKRRMEKSNRKVKLIVRKKNYQEKKFTISLSQDRNLSMTLQKSLLERLK